jgi:transcriptional regulator with XRE-family HTH domain
MCSRQSSRSTGRFGRLTFTPQPTRDRDHDQPDPRLYGDGPPPIRGLARLPVMLATYPRGMRCQMAPDRTEGRRARTGLPGAATPARVRAGRASHRGAGTTSFSEWMRVQLRSRRMSQRQLGARSGVSHATISRILREHREPNLDTAMRLARVLLELKTPREAEHYVALLAGIGGATPPKHVEHALRADASLDEVRIREIMDYYLAVRATSARPGDRSA